MTHDTSSAARREAATAERIYAPLAELLARRSPHDLAGRLVLDAGAGTGLSTAALSAVGARPIAIDLSAAVLRWGHVARPPAAVADLSRLPLADDCVDDAFAGFVLEHLPRPVEGLAELARVTRPGGAVLVSVWATEPGSPVGTGAALEAAAHAARLDVLSIETVPVDVGMSFRPRALFLAAVVS